MLYICKLSNKFDLNQAICVSHNKLVCWFKKYLVLVHLCFD